MNHLDLQIFAFGGLTAGPLITAGIAAAAATLPWQATLLVILAAVAVSMAAVDRLTRWWATRHDECEHNEEAL